MLGLLTRHEARCFWRNRKVALLVLLQPPVILLLLGIAPLFLLANKAEKIQHGTVYKAISTAPVSLGSGFRLTVDSTATGRVVDSGAADVLISGSFAKPAIVYSSDRTRSIAAASRAAQLLSLPGRGAVKPALVDRGNEPVAQTHKTGRNVGLLLGAEGSLAFMIAAAAVAQDKDRRTFELLRVSPLKSHDILGAKAIMAVVLGTYSVVVSAGMLGVLGLMRLHIGPIVLRGDAEGMLLVTLAMLPVVALAAAGGLIVGIASRNSEQAGFFAGFFTAILPAFAVYGFTANDALSTTLASVPAFGTVASLADTWTYGFSWQVVLSSGTTSLLAIAAFWWAVRRLPAASGVLRSLN